MASKPSAAAVRAAQAAPQVPTDKLAAIQAKVKEARDLEFEIVSLEEELRDKKAELNLIFSKALPELMSASRVTMLAVPAEGNMPEKLARLKPYYSANIAASWEDDRRKAAFDLLKSMKEEGLIKTEVSVLFERGRLKEAQKLALAAHKKKGTTVQLVETVPAPTLKAWLKNLVEVKKKTPTKEQLEILGASIGEVVVLEDPKKRD